MSSTFPLIRGKRSELALHKIVKIAVDCCLVAHKLAGFQPAVVTLGCFIGRCPMLMLLGFQPGLLLGLPCAVGAEYR